MAAQVDAAAYCPPLANIGRLPDPVGVNHAYPHDTAAAHCGLEPRFREWERTAVLDCLDFTGIPRMCTACRDAVFELAIKRSLARLGGRALLADLVADVPQPRPPAKHLEKALHRLVGRHEVMARILPDQYPNLVQYRLPKH